VQAKPPEETKTTRSLKKRSLSNVSQCMTISSYNFWTLLSQILYYLFSVHPFFDGLQINRASDQ